MYVAQREFWRLCAGAYVSSTQELLNGKGASLTVDGDFGPLTTTATKNFQSSRGLSVSQISWRTLTRVSLPELAAPTGGAAPSDPGACLMWSSASAQADGIVGPNTKAALYATSGGSAPATGSLATVLSAARAEKGGELPCRSNVVTSYRGIVLSHYVSRTYTAIRHMTHAYAS
jgi:peptidoglycan hydrolase-like protein with peptidoglycan-binding domain